MEQETYCYFNGEFMPLKDAKIGVMTHAFNYGTGCFEGIRAYWNAEQEQLYALRLREHLERLSRSCKILLMSLPADIDTLCGVAVEMLRRNKARQDMYLRPLVYKADETVGVRVHNLKDGFVFFTVPLGAYVDCETGIKCGTSSWRRIDDNMIPARAKVTGAYINSGLAKTEAHENGYDEAIMLTVDGHVSEGSGENIFMVQNGVLITPPVTDNILVGITRLAVMELAADLGFQVQERSIDRSEIYAADEVFMTGTAAQVSPIIEIDHRAIGSRAVGPITKQIQDLYFDAVHGRNEKYRSWLTSVY